MNLSQTAAGRSLRGSFRFFLILFLASSVVLSQQARRSRVIDSILGVGVGTSLDQARAKLDPLRVRKTGSMREEGETEPSEEQEEKREGGAKQAWALRGTNYINVALKVDREGRVVWITGFVRPGKEIPFAKLGNLSSAAAVSNARAIWNVSTPRGGYRVVAKGQNGRARVVSILSLASPLN